MPGSCLRLSTLPLCTGMAVARDRQAAGTATTSRYGDYCSQVASGDPGTSPRPEGQRRSPGPRRCQDRPSGPLPTPTPGAGCGWFQDARATRAVLGPDWKGPQRHSDQTQRPQGLTLPTPPGATARNCLQKGHRFLTPPTPWPTRTMVPSAADARCPCRVQRPPTAPEGLRPQHSIPLWARIQQL